MSEWEEVSVPGLQRHRTAIFDGKNRKIYVHVDRLTLPIGGRYSGWSWRLSGLPHFVRVNSDGDVSLELEEAKEIALRDASVTLRELRVALQPKILRAVQDDE